MCPARIGAVKVHIDHSAIDASLPRRARARSQTPLRVGWDRRTVGSGGRRRRRRSVQTGNSARWHGNARQGRYVHSARIAAEPVRTARWAFAACPLCKAQARSRTRSHAGWGRRTACSNGKPHRRRFAQRGNLGSRHDRARPGRCVRLGCTAAPAAGIARSAISADHRRTAQARNRSTSRVRSDRRTVCSDGKRRR